MSFSRKRKSSNASLRDADHDNADLSLLCLEEEVLIQESFLETLVDRKKAVEAKLEQACNKKQESATRLLEISEKKIQLEQAREKNLQLLKELQTTLGKSEERLVAMNISFAHEVAAQDVSGDDEVVDEVLAAASDESKRAEEEELKQKAEQQSSPSTPEGDETRLKASIETLAAPKSKYSMFDYWKSQHTSSLMNLLPFVGSAKLLERIMNTSALETLSLDANHADGKNRLESFMHTCLWVPLPDDDEETGEGLGSSRASPTQEIDPTVALCPYELSGECADIYCHYQHLKPREVQVLPRELLRLPDLHLPPAPGAAVDETSDKRSRGKKDRGPPAKKAKLDNEDAEKQSDGALEPKALGFDDDFVSLPTVAAADGSSDDERASEDEKGAEDSGCTTSFWWQNDVDKERVSKSVGSLSFPEWLDLHFGISIHKNGKSLSVLPPDDSNRLAVISFIARLLDALRFSLHAGRFDIGCAIGSIFENALPWQHEVSEKENPHLRVLSRFKPLPPQVLRAYFTINNQMYGPFLADFRIRTILSLAAETLQLFHACSKSGATTKGWEYLFTNIFLLVQLNIKSNANIMTSLENKAETVPAPSLNNAKKATNDPVVDENECYGLILRSILAYRKSFGKLLDQTEPDLSKEQVDEHFKSIASSVRAESRTSTGLLALSKAIGHVELFTDVFWLLSKLKLDKGESHEVLTTIRTHLESNLSRLGGDSESNVTAGLSLVPLEALRVCFDVRSRNYRKAQLRVEGLLKKMPWQFSELLWSQLLTLRMLLPCAPEWEVVGTSPVLPDTIKVENNLIAERISSIGLHLNHIVLPGDRNLTKIASKKSKNRSMLTKLVVAALDDTPTHVALKDLPLSASSMPARSTVQELSFPRSLLACGHITTKLCLRNYSLSTLPKCLGVYFPILEDLDLKENELTELPETIGNLAALKKLCVNNNKLIQLPSAIGKCRSLKALSASFNDLSELPDSLVDCVSLENINLESNNFSSFPSHLGLKLPRLRGINITNNPCGPTILRRETIVASAKTETSGLSGPPLVRASSEATVASKESSPIPVDQKEEDGML